MSANTYKTENTLNTRILDSGDTGKREIPNAGKIIEFKITSSHHSFAKFNHWTSSGTQYRHEDALEYLETKSHQCAGARVFEKQGQSVIIKLGQFLTTSKHLEYTFNWSRDKVRYWLSQWQKKGILNLSVISNRAGHKIGTLITCNKFVDFRIELQPQYENARAEYKKLSQNYTHRFCDVQATKNDFTPNKEIKENTYKNNIGNQGKNTLSFEANKKLYDFNAKILEEKKEQAQKLFDLENSLKKERTANRQLKASQKRVIKRLEDTEIEGKVESEMVVATWDFKKTDQYKRLVEALKEFGFDDYAITGLWWKQGKNGEELDRLLDYAEYTLLKFRQGKVKNLKKYLYHALQARYDIGELIKLRFEVMGRAEKLRLEDEARVRERQAWVDEERTREEKREQNEKEIAMVRAWISNNQESRLYEELLDQLQATNSFVFSRLVKSARKYEFRNVVEFMKSDKMSPWDLGLSGLWERVLERERVEVCVV